MKELISKIQYKSFEVGEFNDEKKRSYEETIKIINSFPWTMQRDHLEIALTNPSVTIEGLDNDFLKIVVYYNNKYVLHYFDKNQVLFSKSFSNLNDSFKYIRDYFESTVFASTDFRKENTWLQNNLKHFVSQNFRYELTPKSMRKFIISTSSTNFLLSLFFIFIFLFKGTSFLNLTGAILIFLTMFFIGGGLNLILLFNYYFYAKDKTLIMSKGNDIFYFGNKANPSEYTKKDISQFKVVRSQSIRSPVRSFILTEIELKNGDKLIIPNILVDDFLLRQKLFDYSRIDKGGFPFIRTR